MLGAVLSGALLGALLLLVAEFTALYQVHTAATTTPHAVTTGSHDSFALIPIAALVVFLGMLVFTAGSRPALLAIGVAGVVALIVALVGDLPDVHGSGKLVHVAGRLVLAGSTPSAGFYLETLGAVVLIATCVLGFMMLGRPQPTARGPFADRPLRDRPDS